MRPHAAHDIGAPASRLPRPGRPIVLAFLLANAAFAQRELHTWIGPATGNWTEAANWDSGVVPCGDTADVLIDGNPGQDSSVTLTAAVGAWTNGFVAVSPGDTLRLAKSYDGNTYFHLAGLANGGTLRVTASAGGNIQTTGLLSYEEGAVFNAAGARIEVSGTTSRNRTVALLQVPVGNTNEGTIVVQQQVADRNGATFRLAGTGSFVNNGLVHIRTYGGGTSGGFYAKMTLSATDSSPASSFLGGGRILLDMDDLQRRVEGAVSLTADAAAHVVTNGPRHAIEGGGTLYFNLVNLGLLRASGTNGLLSVRTRPLEEGGKAIVNEAGGRMVAAGPCGMCIGSTSSAPSQFLNRGLLEARAGSWIGFYRNTTASSNKNTPAPTIVLGGTLAGGGVFTNAYRPFTLADDAVLAPGDLANADGSGASTTGRLAFSTNLTLSAGTTLAFQLGRIAAGDHDSVEVNGVLTLAGTLDLAALPGFGGGTCTLFRCPPGALIDNGLRLGSLPAGFSPPQLTIDAAAGTVAVSFPPRGTAFIVPTSQ
jgi:hypothetical protein